MIEKYLSRAKWEKKLRAHGAQPLVGKGLLNTAEWWIIPGGIPFTVPVEKPDGHAEFWAIDRLCKTIKPPKPSS